MEQLVLLTKNGFWSLIFLFVTHIANAVGLDELVLYSYLNEPISAEVKIIDLDPSLVNVESISAELGSPQDFLKANIERQTFLTDLNFEVVKAGNQLYVYVFSYKNLKNPYLELLLKIRWHGGSFIKNYTLLVDPAPKAAELQNRLHAVSEQAAFEQRSFSEEKKIRIKDFEQKTVAPKNHIADEAAINTSQIIFNDKLLVAGENNAELTGMLTLADTSFDVLAAQTKTELEKTPAVITPVNFEAEDNAEKSQILNSILPIKETFTAETRNGFSNKTQISQINIEQNKPVHNEFQLNIDEMIVQPVSAKDEQTVATSVHNVESKQINQPIILEQTKNEASIIDYKSQLFNFSMILGGMLAIGILWILNHRRQQRKHLLNYAFSNQSDDLEKLDTDILSDDIEEFETGEEKVKQSIDRKSIDADIENYRKQLDNIDVGNTSTQDWLENTDDNQFKIEMDNIPDSPKAMSVEKKLNPTASFDISAAREGNSTGIEEPALNSDLINNEITVEVTPLAHYDLHAYEKETNQDKTEDFAAKIPQAEIEYIDNSEQEPADILVNVNEKTTTIPEAIDNTIIESATTVNLEEIKLVDDHSKIKSIEIDETKVNNHSDSNDFELNFDDHDLGLNSESAAALDSFDEANIKLDLAKQYYAAGYLDSAKEVINEILEIGNQAQKDLANELLAQVDKN
jgi:FimV-like protein